MESFLDVAFEFLFVERTAIIGIYYTNFISYLVEYNLELLDN